MAISSTRRVIVGGAFVGLLASVYAANYLVQHVGIVNVWPTHLYAPAGVYMAGIAFLFRDTVQRLASVRLALLGIACGAVLSLLVSPTLAGASAAAFTVSEVTGLAVLTVLGRRLVPAIVAAQVAAALVDSFAFLWLAFGSVAFWQGQTVGKLSVIALAFPFVYGSRRLASDLRSSSYSLLVSERAGLISGEVEPISSATVTSSREVPERAA